MESASGLDATAMAGMGIAGLGYLGALVGSIWILVLAFRKSIVWGLCSFFIPFVSLVFAIMNFDKTKIPFFICLGSGVVIGIGMAVALPHMPVH